MHGQDATSIASNMFFSRLGTGNPLLNVAGKNQYSTAGIYTKLTTEMPSLDYTLLTASDKLNTFTVFFFYPPRTPF